MLTRRNPRHRPSHLLAITWAFRIYVFILLAAAIVWGVYVGVPSPTTTPPAPHPSDIQPEGNFE
jgi:cytoskeletal protein RodZ